MPTRRPFSDRTHGNRLAFWRVSDLAQAWLEGMPLRKLRKLLRKLGFHPWSLVLAVEPELRDWVMNALEVPTWVREAVHRGEAEGELECLMIEDLPPGARLPEGLVCPRLDLRNCPSVSRLPRRLRPQQLHLDRCPRLERLPRFAAPPEVLTATDCPRLRRIPAGSLPLQQLSLDRCRTLTSLPPVLPGEGPGQVSIRRGDRLRSLGQGMAPEALRLEDCPRLRTLEGTQVKGELQVHGCPALVDLPRFVGPASGWVTDCAGLAARPFSYGQLPPNSSLRWQPERGAVGLPPVPVQPRAQAVSAPTLFQEDLEEADPWPWPPVPAAPLASEARRLTRVFRALGLSEVEQIRCTLEPGQGMADGMVAALARSPDPGAAVRRVRRWLPATLRKGREPWVEALVEALQHLSIAPLSLWLALDPRLRCRLTDRMGPRWGFPQDGSATLEDLEESLGTLPGQLVLSGPRVTLDGRLGPRSLEGPLWAAGNLTIQRSAELERLPEVMVVRGNLVIQDLPALRHFPRRLLVRGGLVVRGLPRLERSLCRAAVGGTVSVQDAPALRLLPPGSLEV